MCRSAAVTLTLALALPAAAADTRSDSERLARAVAPFLDERTVAVAHVDLTRVDARALADTFAGLTGGDAEELAREGERLQVTLTAMRRAGGREAFAVFSLLDLADGPFFVVPIAETRGRLLTLAARRFAARHDMAAERVGRAVVIGPRPVLARLNRLEPAARPELARALAAAGDATIQACLLFNGPTRRAFEEILPRLPAGLGGGWVKDFTRSISWAALGVDTAPALRARVTVQTPSADAAKGLNAAFGLLLKVAPGSKLVREHVPNVEQVVPLLRPTVADDRLTLTLDEKALTTVLRPSLVKLRRDLPRVRAAANLERLVLAMHKYEAANKHFPAAAIYDKADRPLLSWRVQLLPYLGEQKLYDEFHLDEPWDSEHNRRLIERMPAVFGSAGDAKLTREGKTTLLAPVGEDTMFPGRRGLRIADVADGTASTIFLVDADDEHAVAWTKPEDWKFDPKEPSRGLAARSPAGYVLAFVDGSIRVLPKDTAAETLRALFTRSGGEVVNLP